MSIVEATEKNIRERLEEIGIPHGSYPTGTVTARLISEFRGGLLHPKKGGPVLCVRREGEALFIKTFPQETKS